MANKKHGYVSTARCVCMNVDALNRCGVASEDMDNGVIVKITKMAQDSAHKAVGYQYEVEAASATDLGLYVVDTPEVGSTIAMQEHEDPREFYNEAGRPMSIKKLVPEVDEIEVVKENFTNATLPSATNKWIAIGAGGKLTASASEPVANGGFFEFVALNHIDIGWEEVPSAIIRYREYTNKA